MKYQKIEKLLHTNEDWSPTLPDNKVRCALMLNCPSSQKIFHRVCLWGGDDLGMEKDFTEHQHKEAKACFEEICGLEEITFAGLRKRGFVNA